MNFATTWKKLLKHCIPAKCLTVVAYVQGALREELRIIPFVERFKIVSLWKS